MADIKRLDKTYIAGTYARFPVQLVSGKGSLAWDEDGKEYIDFGSGIGTNSLPTSAPSRWPASTPPRSTARTATPS